MAVGTRVSGDVKTPTLLVDVMASGYLLNPFLNHDNLKCSCSVNNRSSYHG
jgi:hypothetical protein